MKNKAKKLLSLFLCLLTVTLAVTSCHGRGDSADTTETGDTETGAIADPNAFPLSSYQIVVSYKASTELRESAMRLATLIRDLTGMTVPVREDDAYAESAEIKELLIGATNRAASAETLAALDGNGYVIQNNNGTVVINGSSDTVTTDAVEYFLHNVVRKTATSGGIRLANGYRYTQGCSTVDLKSASYTIVYSASLDDKVDLSYANNGLDYEVQLALDLQTKLQGLGVNVSVTTDKTEAVANEILVGSTNRTESKRFLSAMDGTQYGVGCINGKLLIAGHSTATNVKAVEMFNKLLDSNKSLVLTLGESSVRSNTAWTLSAPYYEGGTLKGSQECAYDEMMYYYTNTTAEEYNAYCAKLLAAGYTQTFSNTIESNQFASYENKYTRIYVYHSPNEKATRLIVGEPDAVLYPTSSAESYEKITDVSITQLQLDYTTDSGGMGYIVTLEDGSFLMIDSGSTTSASAANNGKTNLDHVRIWNLLNQLNKRPDGKIIIRGWIITHEHADHIWVFRKFCEAYGKQVTIEKYYECVVPKTVAYNAKNPDYHVLNGYIEALRDKVNGDFEFVALHAGMQFSLYGADIEILYTVEDLYPTTLHYFNEASTAFTINVADDSADGKYQTLITGDIFTDACGVILKRYTATTLKSDIVQVAHHGNQGATKAFYAVVDPTVALWPTSESLFWDLVDGTGKTSYYVVDYYLYTQLNVKENYTNSDYSVELKLPYTLGSAVKHKASTTDQYS